MRTVERGGTYVRVADPGWRNPLDGSHAMRSGGRWNPSGSFPVVYLCGSVEVARAIVAARLADQPYGPEDLDPRAAPVLVSTLVPIARYVDLLRPRGLDSAGLQRSYPRDGRGRRIGWSRCQPIGVAAWDHGHPGIACRSAAPGAPEGSEELAWFQRGRRRLRVASRRRFGEWFW